jgi:hypothetical protein
MGCLHRHGRSRILSNWLEGSVLKLTKISTVRKDLAEGELGEIDGDLKTEVNQKLKRIFEI